MGRKVLELAITDSPLEQTLGELIGIVEFTPAPACYGSILLLDQDGKHLRHGAAPSLPDALHARRSTAPRSAPASAPAAPLPIGPSRCSSATSPTDPLWADFLNWRKCHTGFAPAGRSRS